MKSRTNYNKPLEEAIIDLYLSVKIRKQEEIENFAENNLIQEKEKLRKTNPNLIIDYIKTSIDILINHRVQEQVQSRENSIKNTAFSDRSIESEAFEYEKELRHLEAEIRNHIRIEHQLKLHIDDLDYSKNELKIQNKSLQESLKRYKSMDNSKVNNEKYESLKHENEQLKHLLKSYEERNQSIVDLEQKLRSQNSKHEKEVKEIEIKYKEKVRNLIKKLTKLESYQKVSSQQNTALITKENKSNDITLDLTDRPTNRNTSIAKTERNNKDETFIKNYQLEKKSKEKNLNENYKAINRKLEQHLIEDTSINLSSLKRNKNVSCDNTKTNTKQRELKENNSSGKLIFKMNNNNKQTRNLSFDKTKILTDITSDNIGQAYKSNKVMVQNNRPSQTKEKEKKHHQVNSFHQIDSSKCRTPAEPVHRNVIPSGQPFQQINDIPCFNNINIYAANMNNFKTNEINLKQYFIKKMNKTQRNKQCHIRSASSNVK